MAQELAAQQRQRLVVRRVARDGEPRDFGDAVPVDIHAGMRSREQRVIAEQLRRIAGPHNPGGGLNLVAVEDAKVRTVLEELILG